MMWRNGKVGYPDILRMKNDGTGSLAKIPLLQARRDQAKNFCYRSDLSIGIQVNTTRDGTANFA